jgi:hypothetical protein
MNRRWVEAAASRAELGFQQCLLKMFRECTYHEWIERFSIRLSQLAPDIPPAAVADVAAYCAKRDASQQPEEAAQSALVWVRSGGVDM